jgi:hypothetical protein
LSPVRKESRSKELFDSLPRRQLLGTAVATVLAPAGVKAETPALKVVPCFKNRWMWSGFGANSSDRGPIHVFGEIKAVQQRCQAGYRLIGALRLGLQRQCLPLAMARVVALELGVRTLGKT